MIIQTMIIIIIRSFIIIACINCCTEMHPNIIITNDS